MRYVAAAVMALLIVVVIVVVVVVVVVVPSHSANRLTLDALNEEARKALHITYINTYSDFIVLLTMECLFSFYEWNVQR